MASRHFVAAVEWGGRSTSFSTIRPSISSKRFVSGRMPAETIRSYWSTVSRLAVLLMNPTLAVTGPREDLPAAFRLAWHSGRRDERVEDRPRRKYTRQDSTRSNSRQDRAETSHQRSLAHALPTSQAEDPDLALIVRLWGRLADECKCRLIEMAQANAPTQVGEDEFDEIDERGA
jgi:hypothetical protein